MSANALALTLLLVFSACTRLGPGGSQPMHEASIAASAEWIYLVLHEVYPSLGIHIVHADDAALSVTSGPLPPQQRVVGASYYRCTSDPSFGPTPVEAVSARVVTRIQSTQGMPRVQSRVTAEIVGVARDGTLRRQPCVSTGVLEEQILRALQDRL